MRRPTDEVAAAEGAETPDKGGVERYFPLTTFVIAKIGILSADVVCGVPKLDVNRIWAADTEEPDQQGGGPFP